MGYPTRESMRRQRMLGRLEALIFTLALVCLLGFGFIAATPAELYRPAPATHHPTPEALALVRQRIQEKIALKPHWYRHNGKPII